MRIIIFLLSVQVLLFNRAYPWSTRYVSYEKIEREYPLISSALLIARKVKITHISCFFVVEKILIYCLDPCASEYDTLPSTKPCVAKIRICICIDISVKNIIIYIMCILASFSHQKIKRQSQFISVLNLYEDIIIWYALLCFCKLRHL